MQVGIAVGVKEDGTLRKYAFSEFGEKYERHPDSHIVFENYQLIRIPELIEFAKKYHHRVPHMGIIAWDFTVDEEENLIIIETNIACPGIWISQQVNGESFFGENTEKMIRMLNKRER